MTQLEATTWFRSYAEAFDSFDTGGIVGHLNVPCTIIGRDSVVAFTTRDQLVANFDGMNEIHRGLGYARAELEDCTVTPTYADEVVEARTTWTFLRADESLIYRFRMIYILVDRAGTWKIAVAINVDGN